MQFKLTTSRTYYKEEVAEPLKKFGFAFYQHSHKGIFEPLVIDEETDVFLNISTLEELSEFVKEVGPVVFSKYGIEIYNDYRE